MTKRPMGAISLLLVALFALLLVAPGSSAPEAPAEALPLTVRWRARDRAFSQWSHSSTQIAADGTIRLAADANVLPGGGRFGEITSPVIEMLPFEEAIVSWNAQTLTGTWLDIEMQVRFGEQWTPWYKMGTWTSSNDGTVKRQSVSGQQDERVTIAVDTLVVRQGQADAARLRIRLLTSQEALTPVVSTVSLALSSHPPLSPTLTTGSPSRWGQALPVPSCSQMVYPDGGEIWCSPTSVAMVLGYWTERAGGSAGLCEPRVREAVAGVYDYVYDGHGNWPFNTAYAGTKGLESYVTRLRGLDEAEQWIARGVPLVVSFGWASGQLDGAPLPSSNGHLAVLSGFDAVGNPVVHDPAAATNEGVRRTYQRDQFERLWLSRSGGTAYIIAPAETFDLSPRLYLPLAIGAP